jgi:hypothetical protein
VEPQERAALTVVCAELTELRAESARLPELRRRLLAEIETRARQRQPIVDLLRQLLGVNGQQVRSLSSGLPGTGPGQADEEVFGCPDGACDRLGTTTPAGPVPRCPLTSRPMARQQ